MNEHERSMKDNLNSNIFIWCFSLKMSGHGRTVIGESKEYAGHGMEEGRKEN